jgi:glycine cleavage system H protein
MARIRNCDLPDDLAYDVEHDQWARALPSGELEFGLTDVGQTLAGKFQFVSFLRQPPAPVPRGKGIALLESAKWIAPFRAAVPGELTAVNTSLLERPALINVEPYGGGWVLRFRPGEPLPWPRGEEAQAAYAARLEGTFRSVAGINEDFWCVHCADWAS